MRSIATCYSEHAIKVSDSYCSGSSNFSYLNPKHKKTRKNNKRSSPSIPNQVTCTYKTTLSNQTHLFTTLTWFRNLTTGLQIISESEAIERPSSSFDKLIEKERGFETLGRAIKVFWDFSEAKYEGRSPEPVTGFYLIVLMNDTELGLALGDKGFDCHELGFVPNKSPKFSLVSKSERLVSGSAFYATRAKFCDQGIEHEIVIKCVRDQEQDHGGDREGLLVLKNSPVLCVCIDERTVLEVKRLKWNFRGNHAIFMDGLLVDMMWDVHDWFFNTTSGCVVFMFRTRSGLNSRLWLEETLLGQKKKKRQKEEEDEEKEEAEDDQRAQFSLLICACKNPD